jgi:hypothetical protein
LVPTVPTGSRKVEKRTFINPNFVQFGKKSVEEFFAEPSSDSASKFKFLALIETHQQSAKILPSPFRFGITADDEFLLSLAAFVIRKGNDNASKIVCVPAIEPSEIHRVSYAVFLT